MLLDLSKEMLAGPKKSAFVPIPSAFPLAVPVMPPPARVITVLLGYIIRILLLKESATNILPVLSTAIP